MELEDSLFPLLKEVSIGIDPYEVFQDAEWALLIGAKPRGPGMERADLLDINGQIFAEQVLLILVFLSVRIVRIICNGFLYSFCLKMTGKSPQCCCFTQCQSDGSGQPL